VLSTWLDSNRCPRINVCALLSVKFKNLQKQTKLKLNVSFVLIGSRTNLYLNVAVYLAGFEQVPQNKRVCTSLGAFTELYSTSVQESPKTDQT